MKKLIDTGLAALDSDFSGAKIDELLAASQ